MSSMTAAKLDGVGVASRTEAGNTYEKMEAKPIHISPLRWYGLNMKDVV
jgi:hypothetical protein